jgi:NAD(P)-dependent dehydrogenase (short-subunit alcohol dehydrogenase family)
MVDDQAPYQRPESTVNIGHGRTDADRPLSNARGISPMKLKGKVAVVTGGARGIGLAIAKRYLEEGATVALADLLTDEAERAAAELGERAFAIELDVTRQGSIDAMVEAVARRAGGIDILVNAAAVFAMAPLLEITRDSYAKVFAVNVEGLLFTLQAVARRMVEQGRGGKIINFASQAYGRMGTPEDLTAAWPSSSPPRTATTWSPRPTTSTAATG